MATLAEEVSLNKEEFKEGMTYDSMFYIWTASAQSVCKLRTIYIACVMSLDTYSVSL